MRFVICVLFCLFPFVYSTLTDRRVKTTSYAYSKQNLESITLPPFSVYSAPDMNVHDNFTNATKLVMVAPNALRTIIQELNFAFAFFEARVSKNHFAYEVELHGMSRDHAYCRMKGYVEHCAHPFVEFPSGNATHTDIEHPLFPDIMMTDTPIQTYDVNDLQLFPLMGYGIAVVVNIPNLHSPLRVSKQTLAKIFSEQITSWNDSAFVFFFFF